MDYFSDSILSSHVARLFLDYSDLSIISVNEEFEYLTGFSQEELVNCGIKFFDLIPEKQRIKMQETIQIQLSTRDKVIMAHDMCDKNGELHHVAGVGQHYHDNLLDRDVVELLFVRADGNNNSNEEQANNLDMFQRIICQLGYGVAMFKFMHGRLVPEYVADTFYKMLNTTPQRVMQIQDYTKVIHEDDVSNFKVDVMHCVADNAQILSEYRLKNDTGSYDWYQVRMALLEYRDGIPIIIATFVNINISKHNELEMRLQNEMLTALIEDKKEQLIKYDVSEDRMSISSVMHGILTETGNIPRYLSSLNDNAKIYKDDKQVIRDCLTTCSQTATRCEVDVRMRVFSGEFLWHRINLVSVADTVGNVEKVYGRLSEIHREKIEQEQLKSMAERDSLTKLYNHNSYIAYVNGDIEKNADSGKKCAFFMMDIDDFKLINDILGHAVGDKLLATVAERIMEFTGDNCFAGRIGGDEFSVFLCNLDNEEQAEKFAAKLHKRLGVRAVKTRHSISMGYEVRDYKNASFNELYQYADQALYDVKRNGKSNFRKYAADMVSEKDSENAHLDSYIAGEGWILDKVAEPLYVSDANTNDMLYINEPLIKLLGKDSDWKPYNKKCYEAIWDKNCQCEDCHLEIMENANHAICDICSENPDLFKMERFIRYKNRKAKLTTFFDMRNREDFAGIIKESMETEDTLFSCLDNMSAMGVESSYKYINVLKNLGEYYGADQASLIEFDESGIVADCHDWCKNMSNNIAELIGKLGLKKFNRMVMPFRNENNIVVIENLQKLKKHRELQSFMEGHRVWSVYAVPLKNEERDFGILILFNLKKRTGKLRLLYMVGETLCNEMRREQLWSRRLFEMYHDSLTGLYNRTYYNDMLKEAKELKSVGVMYADANDLATYNDNFGFEAGNRLLTELADVFKKYFGKYMAFRFDSDDFVVVCENISRDEFMHRVGEFKEEIAKHGCGVSVGFVWDDYHMDIRRLCNHAEEMMDDNKKKYHQQSQKDDLFKNNSVFGDVKSLLEQGNFKVYLQPKFNIVTGKLCGAEALIRLYMPDYGIIAPGSFVELLERSGAIEMIDIHVFEEICKMLVYWQEENADMVPISFNFSRKTLMSPSIFESVADILSRYDVPKSYLEIEVTESIGDMEYDAITQIAGKFHDMGFSLAMDDFGTKYSSIAILSHMNFDTLKIDRSMVNNLVDNEISRTVLKHVVQMCHALGIECIAEGVENEEQIKILRESDCTKVQGYFYDKPLPMHDFEKKYMLHD